MVHVDEIQTIAENDFLLFIQIENEDNELTTNPTRVVAANLIINNTIRVRKATISIH